MKCTVCRSELPANTGFCAGCGHSNETGTVAKQLASEKEIEKRVKRSGWFNKICTLLWIGGRGR